MLRVVASLALVATLAAGCASQSARTGRAAISTPVRHVHVTMPVSAHGSVRGRLVALARRMASGKPIVLAQAVRSTRERANLVSSGDDVEGDQAVWLLQVRVARTIICTYCSAPGNASLPRGRVVTDIVTTGSLKLTDSGIGNKPTDLRRLGHVITLIR